MVQPIKSNQNNPGLTAQGAMPEQKVFAQQKLLPAIERKNELSSAREEIPREEVEKAAEKINRLMGIIDKRFKFDIHEKSGRVLVEIIDEESGKVIDEIPSKKLLDLLGSFKELAGLILDKRI